MSPQRMLDFLAKPIRGGPFSTQLDILPVHFADWTQTQKTSGLKLTVQECGLSNALLHDNPKARMLPDALTMLDESGLAMGVCVAANMPDDWPARRELLDRAQEIIAKADSAGASLHLPANLVPK